MESWIYIGRSQWFYRIKKLLVPVSSKMIIIMVKFCPFYPLIVVKTRSGKLNDWANSLARQVFPLQIENSKLLYYIGRIGGMYYVLVHSGGLITRGGSEMILWTYSKINSVTL